jgi:hypothetical protein
MNTFLRRECWGNKSWRAETKETFPLNGRTAQLDVTTSKNSSGDLATYASVGFVNQPGIVTTAIFSDYFKVLEIGKKVRCTDKNVAAQQNRAVARWAEIKEKVFEFYAQKEAA